MLLVLLHVPIWASASYRAWVQIRHVDIMVPEEQVLREGTTVRANVTSWGRTFVDLVLVLRQGAKLDTLGARVVPTNKDPAYDPRPRRDSLAIALTSEMLREFSDGDATLSAVARGRPQWLREPPPRVQSVRVYIRSRGIAMAKLPDAENALVVRTDFSDQATWEAVQRDITQLVDGFQAYVHFVDDREFSGLSVPELVKAAGHDRSYVMVVDRTTIESPEHPLLVIDLFDEPGRTFRALPSCIQSIENNLSIANMDFEEFARVVGKDGIFRGFPTF